MTTLRDTIIAAKDRKPMAVEVPEWECTVYLRVMSSREQAEISARYAKQDQNADATAMLCELIAACLVDENGNRQFQTEADVDALLDKSVVVLKRLSDEVLTMNGMDPDAVDEAGKD